MEKGHIDCSGNRSNLGKGRGHGCGHGHRGDGSGGGCSGGQGPTMKRRTKVIIKRHRHEGVFVTKGKGSNMLVTRNLMPRESIYGEKRIFVDNKMDPRWNIMSGIPLDLSLRHPSSEAWTISPLNLVFVSYD